MRCEYIYSEFRVAHCHCTPSNFSQGMTTTTVCPTAPVQTCYTQTSMHSMKIVIAAVTVIAHNYADATKSPDHLGALTLEHTQRQPKAFIPQACVTRDSQRGLASGPGRYYSKLAHKLSSSPAVLLSIQTIQQPILQAAYYAVHAACTCATCAGRHCL